MMDFHRCKGAGRSHRSQILVNLDVLASFPERLFDRDACLAGADSDQSGRGTAVIFQHGGHELVLKTYHRGGLPGRFIKRTYLHTGLENSRMWREFRLLQELHALGLPVPRPVAARCQLNTPFSYRGQLVVEKVPGSRTLADVIRARPLPHQVWERIGEVIAGFHNQRVYHHDLNATNILLTQDERVFLIDFDKCRIESSEGVGAGGWAEANLQRLQRSLKKFASQAADAFHYDEAAWEALRRGYDRCRRASGQKG